MGEVVSADFKREMVEKHTAACPYRLPIAASVPMAIGIVVGVVRASPVMHAQAEPVLGLEELAFVPAPTERRRLPLGRVLRRMLGWVVLVRVAATGVASLRGGGLLALSLCSSWAAYSLCSSQISSKCFSI